MAWISQHWPELVALVVMMLGSAFVGGVFVYALVVDPLRRKHAQERRKHQDHVIALTAEQIRLKSAGKPHPERFQTFRA